MGGAFLFMNNAGRIDLFWAVWEGDCNFVEKFYMGLDAPY
jgi:hypothetical protein